MSNRFLIFAQGKYVAEFISYKPTTEMSPQEIKSALKAWFNSPRGWLGRKGAAAFITSRSLISRHQNNKR